MSNDRGWRSLGDMGYVDEDGYLYLTDRSTFMIVSGGVNIYPQEAENLLVMHPKLVDAAVFGVPNDEFGEEVKAVVQPVDGRRDRARHSRPSSSSTAGRTSPPTSARARSSSTPNCRVIRTASSTSGGSGNATGRAARRASCDLPLASFDAQLGG